MTKAQNTLGEFAGIGEWVSWEVEQLSLIDTMCGNLVPLVPDKIKRLGQVVEVIGNGVVAIPLAADNRPIALHEGQWRAALTDEVDARKS